MNPLLLTMSNQVGLLASSIFTYAAAFTPYLILTICLIGLLILACVPGWMREAKLLDEALNFDRECGPEKPNRQKFDPLGGLERQDTWGGGVRTAAPTSKISTPGNEKHTETKCVSAGSGAGASRVESITQRGGECHPAIKIPVR